MGECRAIKTRRKEPDRSLIGRFVTDDIKITQVLNSGSFGHIYTGINVKTDETVAIKIDKLSSCHTLKCFSKEQRIMEILSQDCHVPWAKLYMSDQNNFGNPCLVMEK